MRLIDFFDQGVAHGPERPFLIGDSLVLTYRQVQTASHQIARAMLANGIAPDAKAAVFSPNDVRAFQSVIGILRAGCVWVPINVRDTVEDNCYILERNDVEVLFFHSSAAATVARFRATCPQIRVYVCVDGPSELGPFLEHWISGYPADPPVDIPRGPNDVATLLSTGGTTGTPKGAMTTQLNWETAIAMTTSYFRCPDPVVLIAAPMTHVGGGFALALMNQGATCVVLPAFDAERLMEVIPRYRGTHLFLPPTAIYMLLAHPDVRRHDYSSLRYFLHSAAPMSPDKLKEAVEVFGPVMCQCYAQTEAILALTHMPAEEYVAALKDPAKEHRLASCGRPGFLVRMEIMDDEGRLLPPNEPGEIIVRSNLTMLGYYKNPEESQRAGAGGWHHTGDVGYRDEDGFVYIVDRKRDMIISGGFNIFPGEIERVLLSHPRVRDCAVIGVPDEKWGEAVKAVIETRDGGVDIAELESLCRARLSSIKVPKSFEIWEELPRSPVGKLLKRKIRERFWARSGRCI